MMFWIHLNSDGFVINKEEAAEKPIVEVISVAKEVYDKATIGWKYTDGELIKPPEFPVELSPIARDRIEELKGFLRNTDWIVIEIIEFQLMKKSTPHDIEELYTKRQGWRDEIARLTNSIS